MAQPTDCVLAKSAIWLLKCLPCVAMSLYRQTLANRPKRYQPSRHTNPLCHHNEPLRLKRGRTKKESANTLCVCKPGRSALIKVTIAAHCWENSSLITWLASANVLSNRTHQTEAGLEKGWLCSSTSQQPKHTRTKDVSRSLYLGHVWQRAHMHIARLEQTTENNLHP